MSKLIAVTHNDRFHADDVFAAATLKLVFGDELEIKRSRDEEEIKKADIVFDVGNIYDEEKKRFDHHQKEGAGKRENGIPYASFGLVWKKWGAELCGSKEAFQIVDEKLVQIIDAGDNGHNLFENKIDDVDPYSMDKSFGSFGATWKEEDNYDEAFVEVVKIAKRILEREIILAKGKVEAIPIIEESYKNSDDKRLLILDLLLPFKLFVKKNKDILFVISPVKDKSLWRINAVQNKHFENRKDLPKKWAGLRDGELEKVTGVEGSKFCHRNLFLAVAYSKESALKLAKLALEN
jgi:uncharacterized UPF0160 family protein